MFSYEFTVPSKKTMRNCVHIHEAIGNKEKKLDTNINVYNQTFRKINNSIDNFYFSFQIETSNFE